jgi:hypothetical protein
MGGGSNVDRLRPVANEQPLVADQLWIRRPAINTRPTSLD